MVAATEQVNIPCAVSSYRNYNGAFQSTDKKEELIYDKPGDRLSTGTDYHRHGEG
jgi:hypothetical protein